MRVIVVEPMKKPVVKDIDSGLESLQKMVGGFIECVYPFEDSVGLVCNEDGKFNGMELNRAVRDEDGEVYDVIAGTFLVVGLGDENFDSLTDAQVETYMEMYKVPEGFVRVGRRVIVVPME